MRTTAQIFHPAFSAFFRSGLLIGACALAVAPFVCYWAYRTPWTTAEDRRVEQPVPFSHRHHVSGLGLDCRYCHGTVEREAFAGLPTTHTCMTCHSQIWTNAEMLAPIRASYVGPQPQGAGGQGADTEGGRPIAWHQVNRLPDFVFFNHGVHVHAGVACATCHGRVDQMAVVSKSEPHTMQWCLECHRQPEKYVGAREDVFAMPPPERTQQERHDLARAYGLPPRHQLTNCTMCHR